MEISKYAGNLMLVYAFLLTTCILLVSASIFIGKSIEIKSRSDKNMADTKKLRKTESWSLLLSIFAGMALLVTTVLILPEAMRPDMVYVSEME